MFGRNKRLRAKAEEIIKWSAFHSAGSLVFLDKHQLINDVVVDLEDWRRVVTIALVGSAYLIAEARNPRDADRLRKLILELLNHEGVLPSIQREAAKLLGKTPVVSNSHDEAGFGVTAFSDLYRFIKKGPGSKIDQNMGPGWWAIWNIKGASLSDEELELALQFGVYLSEIWLHQDLVDLG